MRKLLEAIDPGDDIMCLLANEGDVVWSGWVKSHLEAGTKKPGTLILYLTYYKMFLSFVTHKHYSHTHQPHAYLHHHLEGPERLAVCRGRPIIPSKNQRMVDETEGLLTLDELEGIKSSLHYDAVRLAIQAGWGKVLTLAEFIIVQGLLVTRFSRHWHASGSPK